MFTFVYILEANLNYDEIFVGSNGNLNDLR